MRSLLRFGTLALLTSAIATGAPGPASAGDVAKPGKVPRKAPRIAIEPMSHEFGRLLPQRTVQKEFTIRNFGKKDLIILGVSTTCGCTVARMEDTVVKPGRSTPMKVNLETRNYKGRVVRSVLVRSNDPTRAVFEVKVQATVAGTAK